MALTYTRGLLLKCPQLIPTINHNQLHIKNTYVFLFVAIRGGALTDFQGGGAHPSTSTRALSMWNKMANQKLCNGNTILAMHLLGPKLHSKCPQWTIDSSTDKNRVEKSDSLFVCGECLWETDAVWDMLGIVEGSSPHWHPHMKANHKTLGHISAQQHRYKPQKNTENSKQNKSKAQSSICKKYMQFPEGKLRSEVYP